MTAFSRASALRRTGLLATTALFMLSGASAALAQDRGALEDVMNAHRSEDEANRALDRNRVYEDLGGSRFGTLDAQSMAGNGHIAPVEGQETPSITINNNFTTTDARDPVNITGIGQMFINNGNGTVGLCTGTLINPRTVIFAAHCVNSRAATAYGANSGGVPIAFGFETNTRANAAGQPDELINWFNGGSTGPGVNRTNTAQSLYNVLQVFYDPRSQAAASCTSPTSCFLEADVAVAAFDTPTRNIPLWTMLFSPLTAPSAINPATGTGYHVTIAGYGSFGNGTTGSASGSDFRRRVAENTLGALTSINARNLFLFGTTGTPSRPQLLYWLDFDDPRRGQTGADPEDFNGFRDNALTREGTTGPGDSGGPLIIDQAFGANVRTIIGVLSGGSTFFTGQPGGSYGTQSFYQPLFLYWDWIVANNPYRYATAVAGNRNWEDPTAWVTTLDPAYQILSGGQLVNGVPTELGGATVAQTPQFGEACFQSPSSSPNPATNECVNLATGAARNNVPNTPSGTAGVSTPATIELTEGTPEGDARIGAGAGALDLADASDAAHNRPAIGDLVDAAAAAPGYRDGPLGPPTLANGLPGATNFVPNNSDGVRATGVSARYYDITLRNAGTITLNSNVTIDNFAVAGAQSQLTVASGASLTSLLDVNQLTGIMNVNGTVTSRGDYFFMSGLLTGTGRVNANFLTSVMGNFAPGTVGSIGTLTIGGNLVMASGSTYALDVGPNGAADLIAVVANGTSTGTANVGGRVLVNPTGGGIIRFNNLYTILTAAGGVTGTFTSTDISAVLRQSFIYNANSVQLRITAVSFASVLNQNPVQQTIATLLDNNRSSAALLGLYDIVDLQNLASLQATVDGLAPRTEQVAWALGVTATDNNMRVIRDRLQSVQPGNLGGQIAYYGRRVETAALSLAGMATAGTTLSDVSIQPDVVQTRMPEDMGAFFAAGYLEGENAPLAGTVGGGDDQFDGFYFTAGLEKQMGERAVAGLALSYTDLEGTAAVGGQSADGQLYQATLYGKVDLDGPLVLDGQLAVGSLQIDTLRAASLPGQTINLTSESSSFTASAEVGLAALFGEGKIRFGPRGALRASHIGFETVDEQGGITALTIDRPNYDSLQARLGAVVEGVGRIRPNATVTYVHEFQERSGFAANFVGGVGNNVLFDVGGNDQDWFELTGGLTLDLGRVSLSVSADTTLDREDVENHSFRGAIRFAF